MRAILDGRSKVLVSLGGNLPIALPHPAECYAGMRRLDLAVHIATKLNRSHLLIGNQSIILPCLGRTELDLQATGPQSVTVEDSMSMVHASRGNLTPASEHLRSEPAIVAGIAQATLQNSRIPWPDLIADYDRIRVGIEAVFPDFADFNERIRHPGGFRLPLPPTERIWRTASGKAEFLLHGDRADDYTAGGAPNFLLATIRSHDQYNTTIYSLGDRYRGVFGRRDILFMNEADLEDCALEHGDTVDITSLLPGGDGLRLTDITVIAFDIARGSVAAYYPEANCLLPLDYHDPRSGTPSYKSIPVRVSLSS
jgi:molybdopterin-dependent oxidoreductase alpha subunit